MRAQRTSRTSLDTPRAKNAALALLAMTQFVIVIDASIVNVALPSIGKGLSFSRADLSWVVNAYTLTFGGFLLLGGRLADLIGRRRMFMSGLVLLFWLIILVGHQTSFFGLAGWVDREAAARLRSEIQTGWSLLNLFGSNSTWVKPRL